MDRRILLAQKEFVSREMVQSLQGFMGTLLPFYETEEIQNVPKCSQGANWDMGRQTPE